MKTYSLVLMFESVPKSYGVTIQMKPLLQYFCMVPFVFQHFSKFGIFFLIRKKKVGRILENRPKKKI